MNEDRHGGTGVEAALWTGHLKFPALAGDIYSGTFMRRILIAYSTVDGYTYKICRELEKCLVHTCHHAVTLLEIRDNASFDETSFDQIVIGASIRYGNYRSAVFDFIETNRLVFERMPSAFFSVNVVARKRGKDTPATNPYIGLFKRRTTWTPRAVAVFAGKLDYQRCSFFDRQVIRFIMWLTNGPTARDTCVEFTDWQEVERFARRISAMEATD